MVNFDYRRRILLSKEDLRDKILEENPDALKDIEPMSFS